MIETLHPDCRGRLLEPSRPYLPAMTAMTDTEVEQFRIGFSDHAPVWAEFRIDLLDDDN